MLTRSMVAALLLGWLAPIAEPPSPGALRGIITQVQGAVEAVGPGASNLPLATPWQVIQAGVTVRVPKNGSVGIVCSNRRFVRLQGPATWSLTEPACAAGKELTPAEYALIAPQGGRFKVVEGFLVLEREIREVTNDDPLAPVVLSPCNTTLRSPRPTVSWSRVASATEYEVNWSGRGTKTYDVRLQAGKVDCSEVWEGIPVCSLSWPEDRPDLWPGEDFFLSVAARSGIADPWRSNDPVKMHTQKVAEAGELESQLRDLQSLGLEGAALDTAKAGLLAERGLYADAASLYRRALVAAPAPELQIAMGDVEFSMGLLFLAEPHYRAALREDAPVIRAAAAFGLGRVAYTRGKDPDALAFFRQARELYAQLSLPEEEAAAGQAAEKAAARIRNKGVQDLTVRDLR